jgi:hypothetical protein
VPEVQHPAPLWASQATGSLAFPITDVDAPTTEVLPIRQAHTGEWTVCAAPFLIYGLCLGDVVRGSPRSFTVETRSDFYCYRLTPTGVSPERLIERVHALTPLIETWSSLVVVAIEGEDAATHVVELMDTWEAAGDVFWEASF